MKKKLTVFLFFIICNMGYSQSILQMIANKFDSDSTKIRAVTIDFSKDTLYLGFIWRAVLSGREQLISRRKIGTNLRVEAGSIYAMIEGKEEEFSFAFEGNKLTSFQSDLSTVARLNSK